MWYCPGMDGQVPQQEPLQEKPKREYPFKPGVSGNPSGKPKCDEPEVPEPESEVGDGAGPLLKAMRWAVRNDGVRCRAVGLNETQRKALRANPVKFAEIMAKLEALHARAREKEAPGSGRKRGGRDEGHERVRELIDQLLERWGKSS